MLIFQGVLRRLTPFLQVLGYSLGVIQEGTEGPQKMKQSPMERYPLGTNDGYDRYDGLSMQLLIMLVGVVIHPNLKAEV